MEEQQKSVSLSVPPIEKTEPTLKVTPSPFAAELKSYSPKYQYLDENYFRQQFLSNTSFRRSYLTEAIKEQKGADWYADDPKKYEDYFQRSEKLFLDALAKESYIGTPLKELTVNRIEEVDNDFTKINTTQLFDVAKKRKLIDDATDVTTFNTMIGKNEQMRKELYGAMYDEYKDVLGKMNNGGVINENVPDSMLLGFNLYRAGGSEAITKFANAVQNDGQITQDEAEELRKYTLNGESVFDYATSFNQGIKYTPPKLSADEMIPKDYNNFSAFFYNTKDNEKAFEQFGVMLSENYEKSFWDNIFDSVGDYTPKEMAQLIEADLETDGTNVLYQSINQTAGTEKSPFTHEDILKVVLANSDYINNKDGNPVYRVDATKLTPHQKFALKLAIDETSPLQNMFTKRDDGVYDIEPQRQERINANYFKLFEPTKQVILPTENGWESKEVSDKEGAFRFHRRMFDRTLYQGYDFLDTFIISPILNASLGALESMGANDVADYIRNTETYDFLREAGDFEYQGENFIENSDVVIGKMAGYITASAAMGNASVNAAAKAFDTFTKTKRALQVAQVGKYAAKTTEYGKTYARARNFFTKFSSNKQWANAFKIEVGSAELESITALAGDPVLVDLTPQAVQNAYKRSNAFTQVFASGATSVAFGMLIDTALGAARYGYKAVRGTKAFKVNPFGSGTGEARRYGLTIDPLTGDYVKTNENIFTTDWRRMWADVNEGLAEVPVGDIADSYNNLFAGRAIRNNPDNTETLADVVAFFKNDADPLLQGLRSDIRKTLEHYDTKFNAKPMTADELNTRTDEIYEKAVSDLADNFTMAFRGESDKTADLPMKMARMLLDSSVATKQIEPERGLLTFAEANEVALGKPAVVRRVGGNKYAVFEVNPNLWTVDLALKIQSKYRNLAVDEAVELALQRNNPDLYKKIKRGRKLKVSEQAELEKARERYSRVVGKDILIDGDRVRITGVNKDEFTALRNGREFTFKNDELSRYMLSGDTSTTRPLVLGTKTNMTLADDMSETIVAAIRANDAESVTKAVKLVTDGMYDKLSPDAKKAVDDIRVAQAITERQAAEQQAQEVARQTEARAIADEYTREVNTEVDRMVMQAYRAQVLNDALDVAVRNDNPRELVDFWDRMTDEERALVTLKDIDKTVDSARKVLVEQEVQGLGRQLQAKLAQDKPPIVELNAMKTLGKYNDPKTARAEVARDYIVKDSNRRIKLREQIAKIDEQLNAPKLSEKKTNNLMAKRDALVNELTDVDSRINNMVKAMDVVFGDESVNPMIDAYAIRLIEAERTLKRLEADSYEMDEMGILGKVGTYEVADNGMAKITKNYLEEEIGFPMDKTRTRIVSSNLGATNPEIPEAIAKNRGGIKKYTPTESIPKGVVVKDRKGFPYVAKQATSGVPPFPYMRDMLDPETIISNKEWARIGLNQTMKEDGTLRKFVKRGENLYIETSNDDMRGVFLNIQKPKLTRDIDTSRKENIDAMLASGHDAIQIPKEVDGKKVQYFRILSQDQVVRPDLAHIEKDESMKLIFNKADC